MTCAGGCGRDISMPGAITLTNGTFLCPYCYLLFFEDPQLKEPRAPRPPQPPPPKTNPGLHDLIRHHLKYQYLAHMTATVILFVIWMAATDGDLNGFFIAPVAVSGYAMFQAVRDWRDRREKENAEYERRLREYHKNRDRLKAEYEKELKKYHEDLEAYQRIQQFREAVYGYWPGYPPDWEDRRRRILERDGYRCQQCGIKPDRDFPVELNVHHIKPLSRNGSNTDENLIVLCKDCHAEQPGHAHLLRDD